MNKISVIGIGRVGETVAQSIAEKNLCRELMLIDLREGVPQSLALDIHETAPLRHFHTRVNGCNQAAGVVDSDLVIITSGIARREDTARAGFLKVAARLIDDIVSSIALFAPHATILMVSSPVEVLTYQAFLCSGFERNKVLGHSGLLDAARLASFIALDTGYCADDVSSMVIGGSGDLLVPLLRLTSVSGIPVADLMDEMSLVDLVERTRSGGAEIVSVRDSSPSYLALAESVVRMVSAIALDKRSIMPASVVLEGEYGLSDIAIGVPCVIGANGLQSVIEIPLRDDEQEMFQSAADEIRENINKLG
jgi:malate dehydrogenase